MKEIFEEILTRIAKEEPNKDDTIILEYCTLPLDLSLIKPLSKTKEEKYLLFVDGGNGEIYANANVSIQLIRLYGTLYQGTTRKQTFRTEFYLIVTLTSKSGTLTYKTETISQEPIKFLNKLNLSIDSQDETLRTGKHRIKPTTIAEHTRKLAELAFIEELLDQVPNGTILCRDGDLIPTRVHENEFLQRIKTIAREKGQALLGLSKTTHTITSSGASVPAILEKTQEKAPWYYKTPLTELWTTFVKLHQQSKYVFRIDSLFATEQTISALLEHATDLSFPGYPYGLIEADHLARVTKAETELINKMLINPELEKLERSINAHDNL